jgi:transposase
MARAYSHDLRVRVLDAVEAGLSRRAGALRYRAGIATVIRWAAHATRTGETRAQRQGRPPGSKLDEQEAFCRAEENQATGRSKSRPFELHQARRVHL